MAKKSSARRRGDREARRTFDDSAFGNVRFSATYEYNELALARASELLAPRLRNALTMATFASLALLVLSALVFGNQAFVVLIVFFVVSVGLMYGMSNVSALRLSYARSSTLSTEDYDGTLHVAVCDDAVHVRDGMGVGGDFPLSELKTVNSTSDGVLAGFGARRYAYVPRSAMSEGRFRELVRFLKERDPRAAKKATE